MKLLVFLLATCACMFVAESAMVVGQDFLPSIESDLQFSEEDIQILEEFIADFPELADDLKGLEFDTWCMIVSFS